jgi:hypothetical protein
VCKNPSVTPRLAVYDQSVRLGDMPYPDSQPEFLFSQLNICCHCPYVTSSLIRGWVCRLQLLLALASLVILGSESHGTHHQIFSLRFETPQPGPGSRIYISQEQGSPVIPQASYDSHCCGGGIRPRLHTGLLLGDVDGYVVIIRLLVTF